MNTHLLPVYIKGRSEAVAMLDMMMQDQDFMKFMEEFENGFEEEVEQVCFRAGKKGKALNAPLACAHISLASPFFFRVVACAPSRLRVASAPNAVTRRRRSRSAAPTRSTAACSTSMG